MQYDKQKVVKAKALSTSKNTWGSVELTSCLDRMKFCIVKILTLSSNNSAAASLVDFFSIFDGIGLC